MTSLRPDRCITAINKFVCETLQVNSLVGKTKGLKHLYENEGS